MSEDTVLHDKKDLPMWEGEELPKAILDLIDPPKPKRTDEVAKVLPFRKK